MLSADGTSGGTCSCAPVQIVDSISDRDVVCNNGSSDLKFEPDSAVSWEFCPCEGKTDSEDGEAIKKTFGSATGKLRVLDADGVWTQTPGVVCSAMTADCLPVLLCSDRGEFG